MKNTINDLNNILFEQIERVNSDDLTDLELKEQLAKSKTINELARTLVASASISLNYLKHCSEQGIEENENVPTLLKHDKVVIEQREKEMLQQRS